MTTKLKWRLSKLPTSEEVRDLVKDKIITLEEAKEILFSSETEEERDKDSLKEEIKFLRELVEKLSDKKSITETVKVIEHHYNQYPWYQPYYYWTTCGGSSLVAGNCTAGSSGTTYLNSGIATNSVSTYCTSNDENFSQINTF